jgi:acetyl esterase/lipase
MIVRAAQGRARPAAAFLMSAWTDLTASGESYRSRAELDPIHQRPVILTMARSALGPGASAEDPRLSPLFADPRALRALPPMLLQVGGRETLVSDTVEFVARASAAGAEARAEIWPDMIHVFQQFPNELREANEAVAIGGRFLAARLDSVQQGNGYA